MALFVIGAKTPALAQTGAIRGQVTDRDFRSPLPEADVLVLETNQEARTDELGVFLIEGVRPGQYSLILSKQGYVREPITGVVVTAGEVTPVEASLAGEYTELEEFIVTDDLDLGGGTEAALLELRFEAPTLLDSIGADLMSRAGASDAAAALTLVSGATIQDGRFAVIRGLPDRYVVSKLNGVRLPSADTETRAVELDQFPATVIESIQVSKTFTPDQQGDASGGAVDIRLKGIPDQRVFELRAQLGANTNVRWRDDFLSYSGGGVGLLAYDDGPNIQGENIGGNWDGAVGTSTTSAPTDFKWAASLGGSETASNGWRYGGFVNVFYERDSAYIDDGVDDSYWIINPGDPLTPLTTQGIPNEGVDPPGSGGNFKTQLFDITEGRQSVQWGGLVTAGIEADDDRVGLVYLFTHSAEDTATLAIDTRGKEFFFPGYDPSDPMAPGNTIFDKFAAPYLRNETLSYQERTTSSLQFNGQHTLGAGEFDLGDSITFARPEFRWTASTSLAASNEPDKSLFGALWLPPSFDPGIPGLSPPSVTPAQWQAFKPAQNSTFGNASRTFKNIDEESFQLSADLEFPFEQWSADEGYLKLGVFSDRVDRAYDQESFSNFSEENLVFNGDFDEPWSLVFPFEDHPIQDGPPFVDVDYDGEFDVTAYYAMVDVPLNEKVSLVGGVRLESADISIENFPEEDAVYIPPGGGGILELSPGIADADVSDDDVLPAIGLSYEPIDEVTLRASYSQTVARQTFRELSPILQQEFLGGEVFIGNNELQRSSIENFDLRADWRPYEGGLVSLSWFHKDVEDPIEFVQQFLDFSYTTVVNYPQGQLTGWELEVRQNLDRFWERLEGFSAGVNATWIDSEVDLPQEEIDSLSVPQIDIDITSRDMTNAPEHLFNLYLNYDMPWTGTKASLFYTIRGDALVAGAFADPEEGNFIPSVYEREFGTLNFTLSQRVNDNLALKFQAKNLTDPDIKEVYRTSAVPNDVLRTSFSRGVELSLGVTITL